MYFCLVLLTQIRDSGQLHSITSPLYPVADETQGGEPLRDSNPSSEMAEPQRLASSQTRDPDCLPVTEPVDKFPATGETRGQPTEHKHRQKV